MITYLADGWYNTKKQMRTEVLDGAIQAGGMLFRSDVSPKKVANVALKIRMLAVVAEPAYRSTPVTFDAQQIQTIQDNLTRHTESAPALQAFLIDCMSHIQTSSDLKALYLHMMHIHQIMTLLHATRSTAV